MTVALARRAAKAKIGPSASGSEVAAPITTPAVVTTPATVATRKPAPIILATAEQMVEFRPQANGMVLIVSKGRTCSTVRRSIQAARRMYRDLLAAGFRRW